LRRSPRTPGVPFILKASYDKSQPDFRQSISRQERKKACDSRQDQSDLKIPCSRYHDDRKPDRQQKSATYSNPAFLARQTELLIAAGKTGASSCEEGAVSVALGHGRRRRKSSEHRQSKILLTERGASFATRILWWISARFRDAENRVPRRF